MIKVLKADVAVIGCGFGGVAAVLALLEQGRSVVIVERYPWIGGQATSQALCVLDDYHDPAGETTGISRSYAEFRRRIRNAYRERYPLSPFGAAQLYLNPGQSLCSHLSAEPHMAHAVIQAWLEEKSAGPDQLKLLLSYRAVSFEREGGIIQSCRVEPCAGESGEPVIIQAGFFLDATETGDSYPLLNIPYRTGSEARSEFNEPHAPDIADRESLQSITCCVGIEFIPGGSFPMDKPRDYESIRERQKFSLYAPGCTESFPARLFEARTSPENRYVSGAWYYRSVRDPVNFSDKGLAARTMVNVAGNDYHDKPYLARPGDEQAWQEARHLSLCYLYWLKNEAPRDDGGTGYPEIRSVPEMTGTPDGLAMAPYIREGRRIVACTTITERELHKDFWPGARAHPYADSVGLGGYCIDIHRTTGGRESIWEEPRPYQIPLGALVSPALQNMAVANKGIGVTQVANGAYRLHPVEWAIGEAAGMLADFVLHRGAGHPHLQGADLRAYQRTLVRRGVPVYWYSDVPFDLPGFEAAQMLAVENIWPGEDLSLRAYPFDSINMHREPLRRALREVSDACRLLLSRVYLTAHNARKHDVMHALDVMRLREKE